MHVGVIIWKGSSVDAVRELVECVLGPSSQKESLKLHVDGFAEA